MVSEESGKGKVGAVYSKSHKNIFGSFFPGLGASWTKVSILFGRSKVISIDHSFVYAVPSWSYSIMASVNIEYDHNYICKHEGLLGHDRIVERKRLAYEDPLLAEFQTWTIY